MPTLTDQSETRVIGDLAELVADGRRFACIYADPPWPYRNAKARYSAANHYASMTLDEVAALPVPQLVADRAHLHLWTTTTFLPAALNVLDAWGFTYKSQRVWCKPGRLGMGNFWRVSHELLLLGTRGGLPFHDRGQRSWVEAERGRHSHKPAVFRNAIEQVSPGPYLELFAREAVEGWVTHGDQVEPTLPFGLPDRDLVEP